MVSPHVVHTPPFLHGNIGRMEKCDRLSHFFLGDPGFSHARESSLGAGFGPLSTKRADTVGQPLSIEIGVPNMPSLKAKRLSKLLREKVLLEL